MHESRILAFLLPLLLHYSSGALNVDVGVGIGNSGSKTNCNSNSPEPSASSVPKLESAYTALQEWKSAVTDDPLKILETWVGSNVCSYKGVFCANPQNEDENGTGPFVAGIDLNHANIQGTLVKELSLLTDMSLLHLNSNRFTGTLPDTFGDLASLQELDLSNNQLSGPFPTFYGISVVSMMLIYIWSREFQDVQINICGLVNLKVKSIRFGICFQG